MKFFCFLFLFAFLFLGVVFAGKGPEYRALRAHGMGGAFVAVADDKDALYYNPAGLNLMNRLGNFEKNPNMGYMPSNSFDFRIASAALSFPGDEIMDAYRHTCETKGLPRAFRGLLTFKFDRFRDVKWCPGVADAMPDDLQYLPDSLKANPQLADKLARYDRKAIELGVQASILEMAFHNFGFSIWTNTSVSPYIDLGVIIPAVGYYPVTTDLVAQTAFAFSPIDDWSVGLGFKAVKRYNEGYFELYPLTHKEDLDTLEDRWQIFADDSLLSFDELGYALDFGVLWQFTRTVRFGASLRNVFLGKLSGESITPNLSFGAMTSPMILQSNSLWGRKVNFAIDYADVLNDDLTDMPLSHLNFGFNYEQVFLPGVLTGDIGFGFEGGYWTGTLGGTILSFLNGRFTSYAEEGGTRTGQQENRFWQMEVSLGF